MADSLYPQNNEVINPVTGVPVQQLEYTGQENTTQSSEAYPSQFQPSGPSQEYAQSQYAPNVQEQYAPQQQYAPNVEQYQQPQQNEVLPVLPQNPEAKQFVPESQTPSLQYELQPNQLHPQNREGENVFRNPNLDPSITQSGVSSAVSSQQVTARIGGYPVSQMYSSNPMMAIVQQTATAGDPQSANTWQATMVVKIVSTILLALGISK